MDATNRSFKSIQHRIKQGGMARDWNWQPLDHKAGRVQLICHLRHPSMTAREDDQGWAIDRTNGYIPNPGQIGGHGGLGRQDKGHRPHSRLHQAPPLDDQAQTLF